MRSDTRETRGSEDPEFITMPVHAPVCGRPPKCKDRIAIEAMPVNPDQMLFFRLPQGMDAKAHGERLRKTCCRAVKASGDQKEFITRKTKSGVVRGFGIWRIK